MFMRCVYATAWTSDATTLFKVIISKNSRKREGRTLIQMGVQIQFVWVEEPLFAASTYSICLDCIFCPLSKWSFICLHPLVLLAYRTTRSGSLILEVIILMILPNLTFNFSLSGCGSSRSWLSS